ncbi:MAG: PGF-pre-PGF domain-containing protein [Methanosarcinales archaeon]|nr:PGF-pre-PGF domain-containing protein [Methanosarcinales archaeon]
MIKLSILVCFGMALVLLTIGTAAAGTITVNNSTGPVADFTSIQAAVDAVVEGDTILVYNGTYIENVVVSQGNITIESQSGNPDDTTVQANNSNDHVFYVTADYVTINGFNVTGGSGIGFSEFLHSELRNNIISDGGIFAYTSYITMINNTVISKGIILFDVSEGILENNEVFSCSGTGITISNQAHGTLVNNTIHDNGIGIVIDDFADGYIYNNTIYGNEVGITIDGNSYGKMGNNYFNNTMNALIDEPYLGIYSTWNTTKTAGINIIGGPYLGGNYWAHPNGTGFSQVSEDLDGDGICDLPYIIDENNIDYLPLTIVIDDIMPVISITSPADGSSTMGSSIEVTGLVNGTGSLPLVTVNDIAAETTILDFNGTFRATVPLVLGTNIIYANVTDAAGNTNTTFVTVTRTSPSSGGGGGSGGGGDLGGATGEAFENILVKDAATSNVVAGELSRYEFSEEKCHIVHIQFKGVANAGTISTMIEVLKDTSTLVDSPAPGIVYQNMNIWVGNVAFGDDKIEDAVIGFRVSKEWLSENGIEASSIVLYRYSDGKWNQLSTINIDEDGEYIYFEAETPGFSPFAIVGFAEEDEGVSMEDIMQPSEEDISAVEDGDTQPEAEDIPWISAGLLILILVGVHLLIRKRG